MPDNTRKRATYTPDSSTDESSVTMKKLNHEDYTVGWICPLEVELIAAMEMLEEWHECLPQQLSDHNAYTLGSIAGKNIVIAGQATSEMLLQLWSLLKCE